MSYAVLVQDVLTLPCIEQSTVNSTIIDRTAALTHIDFTAIDPPPSFRSSNMPYKASAASVWVGERLLDYRLEAFLPRLKMQGTILAVLVFSRRDEEPWHSRISIATRELARRLGISLVVVRTNQSPMVIATEVEDLLRQRRYRQANEIINLVSLSEGAAPVTPAAVDAALFDSVRHPIAVLGPEDIVIWKPDFQGDEQVPVSSDTAVETLTAPISPGGLTRVEMYLPRPTPATVEFFQPIINTAALVLGRWYYRQRDTTLQSLKARGSLLSELAVLKGQVPSTLVSIAASVGWSLEGWHIVISTRLGSADTDVESGLVVASILEAHGFPVRSAQYLDHWVLSCNQPQQPEQSKYLRLIETLEESFSGRLSTTVFGVSLPRLGPNGFVKSFLEAERLVQRSGKHRVRKALVNSTESPATRLVRNAVSDPMLLNQSEDFLHGLTEPQHELLFETLSVHLELESNISRTARYLGVHRNTVIDRIERIEQLLGASLDEPDLRLAAQIAVRTISGRTP